MRRNSRYMARHSSQLANTIRLLCLCALIVTGDGTAAECSADDVAIDVSPNIRVSRVCLGHNSESVAKIATVGLADRQFEFIVSPGDSSGGFEYLARTTSDFVREYELDIAVNGSFFTPFNPGTFGMSAYPAPGNPVQVIGLSVSKSTWYSLPETAASELAGRVNGAVCIENGVISIVTGNCKATVDYGLGAGPVLVFDGIAQRFDQQRDFYQAPAPRTALALNRDASVLWLIVVDGRQAGYSAGVNLTTFAEFLHGFGAERAINLDGGGSSVMVGRGGRVLSQPIHLGIAGRERPVANHFGIRERPIH